MDQSDDATSTESDLPPALASPFWVKIMEDYGTKSYNYIPSTRRAASADIYNYKKSNEMIGMGENREMTDATITPNVTDGSGSKREGHYFNNETLKQSENYFNNETIPQSEDHSNFNNETIQQAEDHLNNETTQQKADTDNISSSVTEEYMIISGGYTDKDWKTFPVYAFPITSAIRTTSGQWIDLTPPSFDLDDPTCKDDDDIASRDKLFQEMSFFNADDDKEDPWESAQSCSPFGRMGHSSFVYNDHLYVFGGLIYDEEQESVGNRIKDSFRLEDVPYIYRLNLKETIEARKADVGDDEYKEATKGWQRIIPRVKPVQYSAPAAGVLTGFINRGEGQGGLWVSTSSDENDKFVIYGGLRISRVEYDNSPTKFVKGDSIFGTGSSSQNQFHTHKIEELPLGDIWAYDLVQNAWEQMTNSYGKGVWVDGDGDKNYNQLNRTNEAREDDDWMDDFNNNYGPRTRTAHAATLVGNDLVVHGGMGRDVKSEDWGRSTEWETLDDMWIFDLKQRQWKRRWVSPLLVRAYHTLVGWNNVDKTNSTPGPTVAAYGGYTTGIDVFSGDEVAFVFDDLLVSYPPAIPDDFSVSVWHKASMSKERDIDNLIFNRYEHCAVLSKEGVMVVWGGSFQNTAGTHGLWMINMAGEDSSVELIVADPDSMGDYEATITALHTFVILLMFMSMSLTLLLGLTQRYQELLQQANDDADMTGVGFAVQMQQQATQRRGRGLHPEIIDTIPEKIYSSSENRSDADGANEGDEQECCPICLNDYEEGDKLRVLPCGHFMHQPCVDAWLQNNPSCPSCRYSLNELVDDQPMLQLRMLRSNLSARSTAIAQFLLTHEELEMVPNFGGPRIIDLSTFALEEEDSGATIPNGTDDNPTAMQELSDWRRRRRMLRANRLGGFSRRMRQHRGSSILPQTDQTPIV